MKKRHYHVREKARLIQKIVGDWYEPERQDRCKSWIYRHKVFPVYPMSKRTFFRYLKMDVDNVSDKNKESC